MPARKPPKTPPPAPVTADGASPGNEPNLVQRHPNAILATAAGSVGTFTVWSLNRWAGTDLNAVDGAAIAGGFTALVLFIAREGFYGLAERVLYGQKGKRTKEGTQDGD